MNDIQEKIIPYFFIFIAIIFLFFVSYLILMSMAIEPKAQVNFCKNNGFNDVDYFFDITKCVTSDTISDKGFTCHWGFYTVKCNWNYFKNKKVVIVGEK